MSQKKYEFDLELPLDVLIEFANRARQMAVNGQVTAGGPLHLNEAKTLVYRIGTLYIDRLFHRDNCPGNNKHQTASCSHIRLPIQDAGFRNVVTKTKNQQLDVDGQSRHISSYAVRDEPMCSDCRKMKFDKNGQRIR